MMAADDERRFPVLASLQAYRPDWLQSDISAGLAIAAVGLPSAIAYPAIAGLPPETGFYASIAPLVAYAVFGPSLCTYYKDATYKKAVGGRGTGCCGEVKK